MKNTTKLVMAFIALCAAPKVFAQTPDLNVTFRAHYQYASPHECANICGYVDSLGNEYALVGEDIGMS
ncbi:MAG TPA: hypothetical protein VFU15_06335, partial [Bacteroidia bacterium]|nr:hypothetical protein [Bacteroidia bacterium]